MQVLLKEPRWAASSHPLPCCRVLYKNGSPLGQILLMIDCQISYFRHLENVHKYKIYYINQGKDAT